MAWQTVDDLDILASDDGSSDATRSLLNAWSRHWSKGHFHVRDGPRAGFAENFRSLLTRATEADFYAFADQDDVWEPEKLETAIGWLSAAPDTPRLHGGRTRIVDAEGRSLGLSPFFARPPSFRNALVQSIAGGNTMVWNAAAHKLLAEASRRTSFVLHDWWTYMLITGTGGEVRYDSEPRVGYRQHTGNQIGANDDWASRSARLRALAGGLLKDWCTTNLAALKACSDLLEPAAVETLARFEKARSAPFPGRFMHLRRSGVYRQTWLGHIGLYLACLMRWL